MEIANTIRNIRKFNRLTQSEFSSRIGISRNALINYEKGIRTPPVAVLIKISEEFKVPFTDFVPSTLSLTSEEATCLDQTGLINKTIVSNKFTEEDTLEAFKDFLNIHSFPVDMLSSDEIIIIHEKAIDYIKFEFSKLGYIKVSDNK